jgi:hypothetical protein
MADRVVPKRRALIDLPGSCNTVLRRAASLARPLLRAIMGHPAQTQSLYALHLPGLALPVAAHANVTARRFRASPKPKGLAIPRLAISKHS